MNNTASKNNEALIERLRGILDEVKARVQETHPRNAIMLLRNRLVPVQREFRCYELLDSILLTTHLRNLLDMYFEHKVVLVSIQEVDRGSIPAELKSTIRRELHGLNFDRHFDSDYVLHFDRLSEDLTSLSDTRSAITTEEHQSIRGEVFKCLNRAVNKVLEDTKGICLTFLESTSGDLEKGQGIKALEEGIRRVVQNVHSKVFGWP